MKTVNDCKMKLKLFKQHDTMIVSLHLNAKNLYYEHKHEVEYLNVIKINFEIRLIVKNEIIKEYAFIIVNRNL